jgi:hypothetical protein
MSNFVTISCSFPGVQLSIQRDISEREGAMICWQKAMLVEQIPMLQLNNKI